MPFNDLACVEKIAKFVRGVGVSNLWQFGARTGWGSSHKKVGIKYKKPLSHKEYRFAVIISINHPTFRFLSPILAEHIICRGWA